MLNLGIFYILCFGCLILELIGEIKQNSGLIIFSIVFRILQILGNLVMVGVSAFFLVALLQIHELDVLDEEADRLVADLKRTVGKIYD